MSWRPFQKFPLAALSVILLLYLGLTAFTLLNDWTLDWRSVRQEMWLTRLVLLTLGSLIAGAVRIASFHPRFAAKYAGWLAATPWRWGQDLPLGPISLVWEDLLVLLVPLALVAKFDAGIPSWVPVTFFLLGYVLMAVAGMQGDRRRWFALFLIFLVSSPVIWHHLIAVLIAALLAAIVLSRFALAFALRDFPWDIGDSMRELKRHPKAGLSWPLDHVGPTALSDPVPVLAGFIGAALCGWWTFVVPTRLATIDIESVLMPLLVIRHLPIFCCAAAFLRLVLYCSLYWPPISLRGRLMTGHLIIPGYDYVLVSPLLMCAIAYAMTRSLGTHLPLPIVGGLTVMCVAAVGLNGGPTLRRWQLTGHHRILPRSRREPAAPKGRTGRL